ncbi:helix-turn-helix domain-containing protein [Antarcticibacterium sp. 1MA-6-2]|uniref:XRE family transcriptional regulator n=1 Tax=Antarcticibacterium sp. 1MA-6-2 TaxID=2908210 RepID=UPI001F3A0321|nr:S24 family peptidase [Antarcticibacterium sp. 1MA-6-2]UJH91148.1 helix-turn-helix domain-containing protein [Antarcticibacterium sp. 1MA-6-2]
MNNRQAIGSRLKELRKRNKFSQQQVAENLFISQAAYSLIENSQNGVVAEHIISLSNLYDVTTDFILKGDKHLIRISPYMGFVPYIKLAAHAGFIRNMTKSLAEEEREWYRIPGYNPSQDHYLFEVEGSSMVPTILPGDIIICQNQPKINSILDGSIVLIITKEALLVKRFRKSNIEDEFFFDNDNPEDSEILRFSRSEIQEIMMVRGKITNVLIPHHQMASSGKIQSLEESIEFLKKELFAVQKKLQKLGK